jgi:hypothetical protein
MSSKWFQSDPNRSPDSEFEPGELHHLCVGNEGEGSSLLYADTNAYMAQRDLSDLEAHFTRQYVSHPFNEAVKAHRIAIAQLGLATHLIVRMGFVQAIFERCGRESIVSYRMESCEGPPRPRRSGTALVSASFRMDIVQEMSGWADPKRTVAIYRQAVPIRRVLMTYLETEAMNHPYREAEAVLLADPNNQAF